MTLAMETVLDDIAEERGKQDAKWGSQRDHPDGTGEWYGFEAQNAKSECEDAAAEERVCWSHILLEEVFEALETTDITRLREELIQVAAVATVWVEALDARSL